MAPYHIWHPAYVQAEPLILEVLVTQGSAIFLSRGTDTFTRAALDALGLSIEPLSWVMQPVRTHYFSSHRERSGDWRDAWDLAWRLRMTLPSGVAPSLPEPPGWGYFDLTAADGSFRPNDAPQDWLGWNCLILADAPEVATIRRVEHLVRSEQPQAVCEWGKAFGRDPEIRCDLGYYPRDFFEQGATDAEELLRKIEQTGASVRFTGRKK